MDKPLKPFLFSFIGHTHPLQCLECFGEGEHAREACEKKIVSEDCEGENEVCGVGSFKTEDGNKFHRGCITIKGYNEAKAHCTANPGTCAVAMCKTSNCKPELPSIGGN